MGREHPSHTYIELNMHNYDHDEVCQLNEWAIWANDRITELEDQIKQQSLAIRSAWEELYPHID